MSVPRDFRTLPVDVRQWSSWFSGLFFTRYFNATLTGVDSASGQVVYTASAGIVALHLPAMTGTSDSTAATLLGLPSDPRGVNIAPARNQYCVARISDNGITAFGVVLVAPDGTVTLYPGPALSAFTASGAKGFAECTVVYALD